MRVSIIGVERNSFDDENGKNVKYTKFGCLMPKPESLDSFGYDVDYFTTKYENFDYIAEVINKGQSVNLETELTKMRNGYYKAKPVKIDEFKL